MLTALTVNDNMPLSVMRSGRSCARRHSRIAAASLRLATLMSSPHHLRRLWRIWTSWTCRLTSTQCRLTRRRRLVSWTSQGLSVCRWRTLGWMCVRLPLGYERDPRIACIDIRFLLLRRRSITSSVRSLRSARTTHLQADCTRDERAHYLVRRQSHANVPCAMLTRSLSYLPVDPTVLRDLQAHRSLEDTVVPRGQVPGDS